MPHDATRRFNTPLTIVATSMLLASCSQLATKPQEAQCEGHANYEVVFNSTWTAETHPQDFPEKPHYSHLFGATHNADVSFWAPGEKVSIGIKDIAERGSGFKFVKQVDSAIRKDNALAVFDGNEMKASPGSSVAQFKVTQEFPVVTLINMLAPSPDWIAGVSSLNLCVDGTWTPSLKLDAPVYDAGTDDGQTYTAADIPREKREPVAPLDGSNRSAYDSFASVGSFEFKKIDQLTKPEGSGYVEYVRGLKN